MDFLPLFIPDVILIKPRVFGDDRGYFLESWERRKFASGGIDCDFVQDNHSGSLRGVLRGLHYQVKRPQGKLVRVVEGEVYDVAVDMRRSSRSFGRWVGARLSAANRDMLWVPAGFAHGFLVLSPFAQVLYKCTDYYAPEYERSLLWNDPQLGIEWPLQEVAGKVTLSAKDSAGELLGQAETFP
jgi:dTDP-4-dehydrorhamnose 3,5-epimerase